MIRGQVRPTSSEGELGGGVFFPGVFDAGVDADGGEVLVAGLTGDLQGGGAAFSGVGDETRPQGVRREAGGVETGPGDCLGDQAG